MSGIPVNCANCGSKFNYDAEGRGGYVPGCGPGIFDGSHYFCRASCQKEFMKKTAGSGGGAAASGGSSGSGLSAGQAAAIAGVGIGAAAAGAGAALKGVGALAKGLGKGLGAMGDLMKDGVNQSRMNTKIAQDMIDYKFSDDPESYKKEIVDLYETVMEKGSIVPNPQEWSKKTYAKKRLCKEFAVMARTNPELYANYAQMHMAIKKKVSPWAKYIGGFVIIFGALMIWAFASLGKTSANREKAAAAEATRLEAIVKEIDDAIASKDYDTALYKATKLQWMEEPSYNWREKEQWDARREEVTSTIEKLSGKSSEKTE